MLLQFQVGASKLPEHAVLVEKGEKGLATSYFLFGFVPRQTREKSRPEVILC